jgi:hypothetical protein
MQHSLSIYKKMTVDGNWMWKRDQTNPWLLCLWPTLLLTSYKNNKEGELVVISPWLRLQDSRTRHQLFGIHWPFIPIEQYFSSMEWRNYFFFFFFVLWIAKSPSSPFLEVHWWSTHTMYTLTHSIKHCTRIPPSSDWFALFAAGSGWIY